MEQPTIVIAINALTPEHVARIERAAGDWGRCARINPRDGEAPYRAALDRARVAFGWPRPAWLAASPVGFFQLASAGYEPYQIPGILDKPRFVMCNARGVMSVPVAEHAVAMMLALARRIDAAARDQPAGHWRRDEASWPEIAGSTAVVVGVGSIGRAIARRCAGLDMTVVGVTRRPEAADTTHLTRCYPIEQLHDALALADHVFVAAPLNDATRGMVGRAAFDALKRGAFIYNVARGDVIDQPAMLDALADGRLGGAGLDVTTPEPLPPDHPLWRVPNVLITPHVAGRSRREMDRMTDLFARNLAAYRKGEPLENVVIRNPPR